MNDLIGKTLGGYQITEQIGKGGMATVFRAYQPSLDRDVAIKVLPPYYADQDETFIARFKREARAIAKLRHPNILMVMDFGQEEDLSYIVMEYVDAGTLKERMQRKMTLQEIFTLVKQVASALDYAHEQGVVHRDVKPSNILMPKDDWALLTDFGLARMVGGSFMTQSGMTVGTPAYMSPEQGSGVKIDHRTDIYSLGVMLYELVVGEVPYTAETPMAVVVKHIVDPLPMPRDRNPDVPERLQQVILKALAKNPDDRFNHAGEIVSAMEEIVGQNPDWSAASIKVVNAVREPVVDVPDTRVLEEEELKDTEVEAGETPNVKEPPSASRPSAPVKQKPKRKLWAYALGGLAILAVCAVSGVLAAKVIQTRLQAVANQPESNNNNSTVSDTFGDSDFPEGDEVAPPPPEQTGNLFEDGLNILGRGDNERAYNLFRDALRNDPRLWADFFDLVLDRYDHGDVETAFRLFLAGTEGHPNPPPEDQEHFGWLLLDAGYEQEAFDLFTHIIEQSPNYAGAYDGLSSAAYYVDKEREALNFLLGMDESHPNQPLIIAAVADMYYWLNEYRNSIEYYERALELDPNDPWMYMDSVNVYILVNDYNTAAEMIEKAMEMAPNDSVMADMAGYNYQAMGMDEAAVEAFRHSIEIDPENGWAKVGLAQLLMYLERDMDSVPGYLNDAERVGRDNEDYWLLESVAWAWADFGDCPRAFAIFQMIADEAGDMIDVQEGLDYCRPD
jgi:serine/threonine protein kinase